MEFKNTSWLQTLLSENSDIEVVLSLLTADLNQLVHGRNALGLAAENGNEALVQTLIDHGANVELLDGDKWSALMHAAACGHFGCVRILLDYGTNIDSQDNHNGTALIQAARRGHETISGYLIERGANVHIQDDSGWTTLMHVARLNQKNILKMVINKGANIDLQDQFGWTALMLASYSGRETIVQLLIEAKANVNASTYKRKKTALSLGVSWMMNRHVEQTLSIIHQLLCAGANTSMQDDEGKSFIDDAPEQYRKLVKGLLRELVDNSEFSTSRIIRVNLNTCD